MARMTVTVDGFRLTVRPACDIHVVNQREESPHDSSHGATHHTGDHYTRDRLLGALAVLCRHYNCRPAGAAEAEVRAPTPD